jgi:acyl-CoA synthetase (AMP-forming)/AMP-acid ligase II
MATWLSVVPPTLAVLCDRREATGIGARLRFIRSASAPMPAALARRAESLFACPLAEAYGMTETSHQAASNPPTARRALGTVGLPTGVEFREVGEVISGGRELEVRGPALFRGYLGRPDLTAEAINPEGWYRTRDIGVLEPDGYVRLLARSSEIINRGGFKVSPVEVEQSLTAHPGVSASLVAAVPHSVLGEEIGALVVARRNTTITVDDLRRHCRQHLAPYKQPGLIRIVDEIPRLPNGKPSRRLASQLLQAVG